MADTYNILLTERWTYLNAQNNPVDGYRITFEVASTGSVDHVIIAENQYTASTVDAAIRERVKEHESIANL